MKLVFATSNRNKAQEIAKMLPDTIEVITLNDLDIQEDIPETADTLEGNAHLKASYVSERFNLPCFADDTGLEVFALKNEPGVKSARYAGAQRSNVDNMAKLLDALSETSNRSARFRTVIALHLNGQKHEFEGIVEGQILLEPRGDQGFGYDPLFQPSGHTTSFAEMTMEDKNAISHRGRAISKLVAFLQQI